MPCSTKRAGAKSESSRNSLVRDRREEMDGTSGSSMKAVVREYTIEVEIRRLK